MRGPVRVAVNREGDAIAVWAADDGAVVATTKSAGEAWSEPNRLNIDPWFSSDSHTVGIDARGDAVVTWATWVDSAKIESATRPAHGGWSRPEVIDTGNGAQNPRMAINAKGDAAAIWERATDPEGHVFGVAASTRRAGESWAAPQTISQPDGESFGIDVAVNSHGDAVALVDHRDVSPPGLSRAQVTSHPTQGRWSQPRNLTTDGFALLHGGGVTVNGRGDAVTFWDRSPAPGQPTSVEAAFTR